MSTLRRGLQYVAIPTTTHRTLASIPTAPSSELRKRTPYAAPREAARSRHRQPPVTIAAPSTPPQALRSSAAVGISPPSRPTHLPLRGAQSSRPCRPAGPNPDEAPGWIHAQPRGCGGMVPAGSRARALEQSPKVIALRDLPDGLSRPAAVLDVLRMFARSSVSEERASDGRDVHHVPTLFPEGVRSSHRRPFQKGGLLMGGVFVGMLTGSMDRYLSRYVCRYVLTRNQDRCRV